MVEPPATVGRACISIGPAYLPLLDDSPEGRGQSWLGEDQEHSHHPDPARAALAEVAVGAVAVQPEPVDGNCAGDA
jgi:hypothetical protein